MIEPVRQGQELLEEITNTTPPPARSGGVVARAEWLLDQVAKRHAGRRSVSLRASDQEIRATSRPHIRMTRAPLRGKELPELDLVLASHKHSDHFDPETCPRCWKARRRGSCMPEAIRDHALGLGLPEERIVGLVAGQTWNARAFASAQCLGARRSRHRRSGASSLPGVCDRVGGAQGLPQRRYTGLSRPDGVARSAARSTCCSCRSTAEILRAAWPANMTAREAVELAAGDSPAVRHPASLRHVYL